MIDRPEDERWMEQLAGCTGPAETAAPSRLKANLYSRLVREQTLSPGMAPLSACEEHGFGLCVFEKLVRIASPGERMEALNPCRVCHARFLAERLENAPIYWPHCPYAKFQNR
ncbi:MAG: hypothetical protein ACRD4P_16595 [Bryobacteraceae bacterium]